MKERSAEGYTNYILSDNEKQLERLRAIFNEIDPELQYQTLAQTIHEGFTGS